MMVIGVDTHKSSHAMAAVAAHTGLLASECEIAASEGGHRQALSWAKGLHWERVWAIEDCRHVSRRLEQALIAQASGFSACHRR
jgi:transposase